MQPPPLFKRPDQVSSSLDSRHSNGNTSGETTRDSAMERSERPTSPTKGMGGFVQSAMLRRTESVNKRWSSQAASGVSRQNSTSSFRRPGSRDKAGLPSTSTPTSAGEVLQPTLTGSKTPELRPSPSYGSISETKLEDGGNRPAEGLSNSVPDPIAIEQITPPSPSKRWSPVKSSWLESALSKPESPKPSQRPSQPNWLSDLNKSKQQRTDQQPEGGSVSTPSNTRVPAPRPKPSRLSEEPVDDAVVKPLQAASIKPADDDEPKPEERTKLTDLQKPATKSKPITPPKKDFRSSLKTRQESPPKQRDENPEFLNAFGNLKRAKTEKFVAPDELKNNILRGKAGLSTTGGPQPSQRKDEFKESLLQQKASIKAKPANPRTVRRQSNEKSVPEALAKRKVLGRADGNLHDPKATDPDEDLPKSPRSEIMQEPVILLKQMLSEPTAMTSSASLNNKLAGKFNPALASIIARGPRATASAEQQTANPTSLSSYEHAHSSSQSLSESSTMPLEHKTKSRARGPKRRAPKTSTPTPSDAAIPSPSTITKPLAKSKPVPARSSRNVTPTKTSFTDEAVTRGLPRSVETAKAEPQTSPKPPEVASANDSSLPVKEHEPKAMSRTLARPSKLSRSDPVQVPENESKVGSQTEPVDDIPKQSVRNATARWGRPHASEASGQPVKSPIRLPTHQDEATAAENAGLNREDKVEADRAPPAISDIVIPPQPNLASKPRFPTAAGSSLDELSERSPISATENNARPKETPKAMQPKPPNLSPKSQASEAKKSLTDFFGVSPMTAEKLSIDVPEILSAEKPHTSDKIKTLRKHIQLITSDGKTDALPSSQEHVLYSSNMYLCTHVFGDSTGARRTEVYLWSGRAVSTSEVDDVQILARKEAKEANASLHVFEQGQEPSNFFQALGGIVITRRASSGEPFMLCGRGHLGHVVFDEVDYSANSLCGGFPFIVATQSTQPSQSGVNGNTRPTSSSGSSGAKLYLWKGVGCNAEELGCARLVSMDMDPSATIVEVDEGSEPAEFLSLLPSAFGQAASASIPHSFNHWRLKSKHDNYHTRLFRISHNSPTSTTTTTNDSRPSSSRGLGTTTTTSIWNALSRRGSQPSPETFSTQQITELAPYTQSDLSTTSIYVLDAFFKLYILIGPQAQAQQEAFATALAFAQEYAILAAGEQDRPFVPTGTVVLRGVPKDLKACFRGWDEGVGLFGVGKAQELSVVPLSAALVAIDGG